MDKKIIKNYIYNLSYQILVIIVPLITTPYVARVLGAIGVGTYSYTNSITQYFILFGTLGLNLYAQREIAYNQENKEKYSKVFYEIFCLRVITLSLSIICFYFMASLYTKYTLIFYIQIIDIISSIFDISWLFQGLEDFKKIVIRNFIVKIIGVLCIFVFIKSSDDLWLYVLCHSITILLGNLSMWYYLPKIVERINFKKLCIRRHLSAAIALFIPQIATSLYTLLDKTMIGLLTGNESEVAYYEQSQKIVKIALTVATSLGTVMMPRIASVFANDEKDKINDYMFQSFQFTFALSVPIMFGIMAIAPDFVPWFFGEGFDKVVLNMIIISPIIFVIGLSNVMGTLYLLPTNHQKEYTISVVAGSISNAFFNLFLIPCFLSYGAAVATVISEAVVSFIQILFVKKYLDIVEIFLKYLKYLLYGFIMYIVTFIVGIFLPAHISTTFLQITIGVFLYVALLMINKDELILQVYNKIKKN